MKRVGNIYGKIISIENLMIADKKAQKGKSRQVGVIRHNARRQENIMDLYRILESNEYRTSEYEIFTIFDLKERIISKLPYYPDRIVHHAIMQITKPIFVSTFTSDTYSCIEGRGVHAASRKLRISLRDEIGTKYCLKLDITKFYPSIDHEILKSMLRKKFKDKDFLVLMDEIIDSAPGLPIGNYLSQYLANFYLAFFDHWIKENMGIKHYFRYADDMVILGASKEELHSLLHSINEYLHSNLKLSIKPNYQIFPVQSRGIDFVGYVFYHTHTMLRKRIKKNFARSASKNKSVSIPSYMGWAKHCNSKNLIKKLIHEKI